MGKNGTRGTLKGKFWLLLGVGNKNIQKVQNNTIVTNTNDGSNTDLEFSECIRIMARIKLAIADIKVKIFATLDDTSVAPHLEDQGNRRSCLTVSLVFEASSKSPLERTGFSSLQ